MPVAYFPSQEEFQRSIIAKTITRSGITDVSDVSMVNSLAAAVARALDQISYAAQNQRNSWNIAMAAGSDLDARALDYLPAGISRIAAQPAGGYLQFGRQYANSGSTVTLPIGTTVNDGAGNVFATTTAGALGPGNTSLSGQQTITIAAQAVTPGASSNVSANKLVAFGTRPSGIDTVTNPAAMTGGADQESDDSFRQRIYAYVGSLSRGTPDAITTALLGLQSGTNTILSCSVVTDPYTPGMATAYIDNGSGTFQASTNNVSGEPLTQGLAGPPVNSASGGEQWLNLQHFPVDMNNAVTLVSSTRNTLVFGMDYHLDQTTGALYFPTPLTRSETVTASYTYFGGIVALAQKVITGDPNDRANYPGIAAAGTQVVVALPTSTFVSIALTAAVANGYNAQSTQDDAVAAAKSVVSALPVGAPLYLANLIVAAMSVPGVTDVTISNPTGDVLASNGEIIRPSDG